MSRIGQGAWRLQQANNPDSSSRCVLVTRGIGSFGHVPLECAGAICERLQEVSLNGVSSSGQQHSCRIVNLYRPGDNNDLVTSHVIPAMIRKFKEAKEQNLSSVTLWRDGSPTREFLHVEDAAEGIVLAAERYDKPEPVNLGSGQEISIKDLANLIRKLTGYQGAIIWNTTKPNGQPRRLLDVSRAEQEFGFRASSSLTGRLVAQGCVARIFDDLSSGKGEDVGAGGSLTVGDVRDKPAVGTAVSNDVDCVFHLAAQIDVRRAVADPWLDVQVNVGGTINVLNACVEAHVRRFVMSSTGQRILHNCHER